jgi:threonyl-tRNA synthetase
MSAKNQAAPPIEMMRHSCAHLLAAAVQELYPAAKFGVGPVVENGFYYDIDLPDALTPLDLQKIEKRMQKIKERGEAFAREEMSLDDAVKLFREAGQDYKVELLTDLKIKGTTAAKPEEADLAGPKPDVASIYRTGRFTDLCRGPHVASTRDISAFKLTTVAGAYWRGDEKNKMLQRIYGLCFATRPELDAHLEMLSEAERRDHKKLGPKLDLFVFSELVGAGLPMFTPRGQLMRELLDGFIGELRRAKGYERVDIPHITKKELYLKSGHWAKYQDDLFKITTREGHEFAMKPMNCPHHTQIYARQQWSYRDLPQRYANTTMVYRDEQTGELSGLGRVRSITQDDAHVFCRMDQVKKEMLAVWDIVHKFYGTFGMKLALRLSMHDPKHPEKYLGDKAKWRQAEDILREIAASKRTEYTEEPGEAAFYGPKLDFTAKDSIGRTWQVATIQLDMNMPESFDLTCVNEDGEKERIVMIHAAIAGSLERFMAVAIEHFAGAFPLWLAPAQVAVIPVGQDHFKTCRQLAKLLGEAGLRVAYDELNESVGKKIRKHETMKVPYMLVIGDKEKSLKKLNVRVRGKAKEVPMTLKHFTERCAELVAKRKLTL